MYHWYFLLKREFKSSTPPNGESKLIHGYGTQVIPNSNVSEAKLFWIGALEILPIIGGGLLSEYFRPLIFNLDYLFLGTLASIITAYIFRKDVPDQPIGIHMERRIMK